MYNPAHESFFPSCPFKSFTGLDCPGCGSQRAVHEMLHLHFGEAFRKNALAVLALPYIFLILLFPKTRRFLLSNTALLLIIATLVGYFFFRNR
ncbi:MAG: DUF2752 domain-containing protein [Chryseobacterium sp.]|nr:DUF2752 domain-containing protein [Chryseobacterium sp.]